MNFSLESVTATLRNFAGQIDISAGTVAQVLILYIAIYAILKSAKGSRFGQVLMGGGFVAAVAVAFTLVFQFDVLTELIRLLLLYLALSSVVIFQPEIRRLLSTVGAFGYLNRPTHEADGSATPEFVVEAIIGLAERRIGALIAFERGISLRSYETTGVKLDASFSKELLTSIFTPPLPLHDGGITIRGGRISAAHCVFPVSSNLNLASRGLRHRAGVGLSEETDALIVIVSEERGSVSIAHNGKITHYAPAQVETNLHRYIAKAMRPRDTRDIFQRTYAEVTKYVLSKFLRGGERK